MRVAQTNDGAGSFSDSSIEGLQRPWADCTVCMCGRPACCPFWDYLQTVPKAWSEHTPSVISKTSKLKLLLHSALMGKSF